MSVHTAVGFIRYAILRMKTLYIILSNTLYGVQATNVCCVAGCTHMDIMMFIPFPLVVSVSQAILEIRDWQIRIFVC